MPKTLCRLIVFILVPLLIADPALGELRVQAGAPGRAEAARETLFQQEALSAALEFAHGLLWRSQKAFQVLSELGARHLTLAEGTWDRDGNVPSGADVIMPERPDGSLVFSEAENMPASGADPHPQWIESYRSELEKAGVQEPLLSAAIQVLEYPLFRDLPLDYVIDDGGRKVRLVTRKVSGIFGSRGVFLQITGEAPLSVYQVRFIPKHEKGIFLLGSTAARTFSEENFPRVVSAWLKRSFEVGEEAEFRSRFFNGYRKETERLGLDAAAKPPENSAAQGNSPAAMRQWSAVRVPKELPPGEPPESVLATAVEAVRQQFNDDSKVLEFFCTYAIPAVMGAASNVGISRRLAKRYLSMMIQAALDLPLRQVPGFFNRVSEGWTDTDSLQKRIVEVKEPAPPAEEPPPPASQSGPLDRTERTEVHRLRAQLMKLWLARPFEYITLDKLKYLAHTRKWTQKDLEQKARLFYRAFQYFKRNQTHAKVLERIVAAEPGMTTLTFIKKDAHISAYIKNNFEVRDAWMAHIGKDQVPPNVLDEYAGSPESQEEEEIIEPVPSAPDPGTPEAVIEENPEDVQPMNDVTPSTLLRQLDYNAGRIEAKVAQQYFSTFAPVLRGALIEAGRQAIQSDGCQTVAFNETLIDEGTPDLMERMPGDWPQVLKNLFEIVLLSMVRDSKPTVGIAIGHNKKELYLRLSGIASGVLAAGPPAVSSEAVESRVRDRLAEAQALVTRHEGRMTVKEEPNGARTITVAFDLESASTAKETPSSLDITPFVRVWNKLWWGRDHDRRDRWRKRVLPAPEQMAVGLAVSALFSLLDLHYDPAAPFSFYWLVTCAAAVVVGFAAFFLHRGKDRSEQEQSDAGLFFTGSVFVWSLGFPLFHWGLLQVMYALQVAFNFRKEIGRSVDGGMAWLGAQGPREWFALPVALAAVVGIDFTGQPFSERETMVVHMLALQAATFYASRARFRWKQAVQIVGSVVISYVVLSNFSVNELGQAAYLSYEYPGKSPQIVAAILQAMDSFKLGMLYAMGYAAELLAGAGLLWVGSRIGRARSNIIKWAGRTITFMGLYLSMSSAVEWLFTWLARPLYADPTYYGWFHIFRSMRAGPPVGIFAGLVLLMVSLAEPLIVFWIRVRQESTPEPPKSSLPKAKLLYWIVALGLIAGVGVWAQSPGMMKAGLSMIGIAFVMAWGLVWYMFARRAWGPLKWPLGDDWRRLREIVRPTVTAPDLSEEELRAGYASEAESAARRAFPDGVNPRIRFVMKNPQGTLFSIAAIHQRLMGKSKQGQTVVSIGKESNVRIPPNVAAGVREAMLIGPGTNAAEIISLLKQTPSLERLHVVYLNTVAWEPPVEPIFRMEVDKFLRAHPERRLSVDFYEASILLLPAQLFGRMDLVFMHSVIDVQTSAWSEITARRGFTEIARTLKADGHFVTGEAIENTLPENIPWPDGAPLKRVDSIDHVYRLAQPSETGMGSEHEAGVETQNPPARFGGWFRRGPSRPAAPQTRESLEAA